MRTTGQSIGLGLGIALPTALLILGPPDGLSPNAWTAAALIVLMATWWVSEALPIAVTSLLPMVVLPLGGVASFKVAAAPYASPIVMLLMGGFIIAKSVERWNLHERVALNIVLRSGSNQAALVAGFMAAAALLSMWISNTATTIMLLPIAISVAQSVLGKDSLSAPFTLALLLGLAYGASIGGLGTPVGTPTNLIVIGYLTEQTGTQISFARWMLIGLPVVCLMLPAAWLTLTRWAFALDRGHAGDARDMLRQRLIALGRISTPERRVLAVFCVIAGAWIFRKLLNDVSLFGAQPFAGLSDPLIAIAGAVAFFLVPSGSAQEKGAMLLDWETAVRIPWGVVLLFGGGLSMASAITNTGLAAWLGGEMASVTQLPLLAIMAILTAFVIFATEVSSNVATASALLPVIGAIASAGGADPILLAMPVAMATSCAFMLPMATGPNAIIFSSGQITMAQMAAVGIRLNVVGVVLISLASYALVPAIFGR
ncbi:MAG: DASS family sodium-coupled anion symporter [Pseudomonadota bacterium]